MTIKINIRTKRAFRIGGLLAVELMLGFGVSACSKFGHHDRNKLWEIVGTRCAKDSEHKPCAVYDPQDGYALLKDLYGHGQYLLIPTKHIPGVESPALLQADSPNYFAEAWAERGRVSKAYGYDVPDADMSLAINSRWGRSQDQLHIHIDCMKPYVKTELAKNWFGQDWSTVSLMGHLYRARIVQSLEPSPFKVLHADDMSVHTLFVTPAPKGGFILLDDVAHGLDRASGEELQDHKCLIADPAHMGQMDMDNMEHSSGMGTM
ncbi:CDP-diacylglycerol diphosphatase [Gluconobacter wancherniae]|uniref:CDP-diacylglycerol diphosphatase n=1 Tax=Gluconobacter wancherniae TaxID=1307955 RepID=UPI001B8BD16D|nr:CDP-diacylglycerol diphosphatase [Gluconobacter wancherniae]MBS1087876.1 CDP-diacylglycerol diphosphatase [Gluconobacter wancherniae]